MLSQWLLLFSYGIALSFIGSLPFGIINMTVAETTVRKGFAAGVWVAVGASVVEFIQVLVSLKLIGLFVENSRLEKIFDLIALLVFLGLAIISFRNARKEASPREAQVSNLPAIPDFFRGALVSSFNVMVFPYWIFYGAYFSSHGWMKLQNLDISIFSAGAMTGTFVVLLLYARLGLLLIRRASALTRYVNWFLFALFLGLGIFQGWKILAGSF
ncbi:MAG: LysE family transporter [Saprospirales bacterium]|nr:LysE family transporter [Saprospirales bacterium]